jgi:hypothetical protein
MNRIALTALLLAALGCAAPLIAQTDDPQQRDPKKPDLKNPKAIPGAYILTQFGPVSTPETAAITFASAEKAILAAGGGILIIPSTTAPDWHPATSQQNQIRIPEPPAPASKTWRAGPGYSIIDLRQPQILPPSSTGLAIKRQLKVPQGQSLPHWSFDSALKLRQSLLRGGSSHQSTALAPAPQGKNVKLALSSVQGIFPGQALYTNRDFTGPWALVNSLGFDTETKTWFVLCDVTGSIPKDSPLFATSYAAGVLGETWSHNENQTFDMMVWRHNFSQGTNELVNARFKYMGDNQPHAADGGSAIFNAVTRSEIRPFSGAVQSYAADTQSLVFSAGASNTDTLASGRPIINLNPAKSITQGSIFIMNPGGALLNWGGSVRFTQDAPITPANIGDYIAIDEPSEHIPASDGVRRWYLISAVDPQARTMSVIRHWWGAKSSAGISRLYKSANYTNDAQNPVLLKYIIAPGANVYDASAAVTASPTSQAAADGTLTGKARTLRIVPGPATGTPRDFAPGDPITQAVGPDPFSPITLRSWIFEEVPSAFPSPVVDIRNHSRIARYAALRAGNFDIATAGKTFKGPLIPFNSFIEVHCAIQNGILFKGDIPGGAFIFAGPAAQGRSSLFTWKAYIPPVMSLFPATTPAGSQVETKPVNLLPDLKPREINISLAASPSGQLLFNSSTDFSNQSINITGQLGKSNTPSQPGSFRQTAIPVPKGQTTFTVPTESAVSPQTQILVTPSWMTSHVIQSRGNSSGFTVEFDRPAPENATLSWMAIN